MTAEPTATRPETWEDPRVVEGTRRQLQARDRLLAEGARRLGWKLGLGAPPARERWEIKGPAVGFITDATLLESGSTQSLAGWEAPALEAEVAVRVAREGGGARVAALGVAIELADLGSAPGDLTDIVAGDIFHRRTVLGALDLDPATPVGAITVERDGEESCVAEDATALVGGTAAQMTAYLDRYLAAIGEELRDGDVIITGSTVPPVACHDGGRFRVGSPSLGAVEITLVP